MEEEIKKVVMSRMPDTWMPKRALFGCLEMPRPRHGVNLRWKDGVKKDMVFLGLFSGWYDDAQDRKLWHDKNSSGVHEIVEQRVRMELARTYGGPLASSVAELPFCCQQCHLRFRRAGDMKHHRCASRSSQRLAAQRLDYLQCPTCHRSFRRRSDKARHKCDSSRGLRADVQ